VQQRRILWLALFVSTVIYAVIAYTLPNAPTTSFDESVRRPMVLPLYVVALSVFVAGLVGFGRVKTANPQAGMILRLALFEACAIMGLIAAVIASDWRLYLPTWALAAIGFFKEWPSE
jgi:uncharacterized membrane protein